MTHLFPPHRDALLRQQGVPFLCPARSARWVVLILTVACALTPGAYAEQMSAKRLRIPEPKQLSLFDRERRLTADGGRGPYRFADGVVLRASEKVWVDGRRQKRDAHYRVDVDAATVTFFSPVARGAAIVVRYRQTPRTDLAAYRRRRLPAAGAPVRQRSAAPRMASAGHPRTERASPPHTDGLTIGGSKRVQVTVGSGGQSLLNQSLRVNISGELADGVEMVAILSDQDVPVQAKGTTRDLRELDQVLFQVRSPTFFAGLGDMDVVFDETTFGRYRRTLQGASLKYRTAAGEVEVVGAVSKGSWFSARIAPSDGYQGPYRLHRTASSLPSSNLSGPVIAGSERVHLDGRLLTRGESQDYAIDYDRGTITFTPAVPIRGDSRIAASFQVEAGGGGHRLVGFRSRYGSKEDLFQVGATLLREGPRSHSMLTGATVATVPDQQVSVIDAAFAPLRGLSVDGELALSRGGPQSPTDNLTAARSKGRAVDLGLDYWPAKITLGERDFGRFRFSGRFRDRGEGFSTFSPVEPASSEGRWGWQPEEEASAARTGEVDLQYDLRKGVRLTAGYGRKTSRDRVSRRSVGFRLADEALPQLVLNAEAIDRGDGQLASYRGRLSGEAGRWHPEFRFRSETATGDAVRASSHYYASAPTAGIPAGVRHREIGLEVGTGRQSLLSWSSGFDIRRTSLLEAGWRDSLRSWSSNHRLSLSGWRGLSFAGDLTHARMHDLRHPASSHHTNLARIRAGFSPQGRGLSQRLSYRISSTGTPAHEPVYAYVGRGVGTHLWEDADGDGQEDPEEFVPDAYGDYQVVEHFGTDYRRVREATMGVYSRLDLARLLEGGHGPLRRALSQLSTEVSVDADRQVTPVAGGLAPWQIYTFSRTDEIVRARREIRAALYISRYGGSSSLRLQSRRSKRIDRLLSSGGSEDFSQDELLGRVRYASLDLEGTLRSDRRSRGGEPTFAYDVRGRTGRMKAASRLGRVWHAAVGLQVNTSRERLRSLDTMRLALAPEASRSLSGRGRLRARLDWARVWANGGVPLFLGMSEGDRPGRNFAWRLGLDYRVSSLVTAMLLYNGRVRPRTPSLHIGRMEMRATF